MCESDLMEKVARHDYAESEVPIHTPFIVYRDVYFSALVDVLVNIVRMSCFAMH